MKFFARRPKHTNSNVRGEYVEEGGGNFDPNDDHHGRRMSRQAGGKLNAEVDPGDANNNDYYNSLDSDAAETALLSNIEERGRRRTSTGNTADGFRPAVDGERAPLAIDNLGTAFDVEESSPGHPKGTSDPGGLVRPQMARQWRSNRLLKSSRRLLDTQLSTDKSNQAALQLLTTINSDDLPSSNNTDGLLDDLNPTTELGGHPFGGLRRRRNMPSTLDNFENIWDNLGNTFDVTVPVEEEEEEGEEEEEYSESNFVFGEYTDASEGQPLLQRVAGRTFIRKKSKFRRCCSSIAQCLNPFTLLHRFIDWMSSSFLLLAFPSLIMGWILYYHFGNPALDFLPGTATLSWWFNFAGRQLVLLEVARVLQYVLIDCIATSTKIIVSVFGAWSTIFCLQARGWPFLIGTWGILAMIFLQGDNDFQAHWLYFTGIQIYSRANSGSYIVQSDLYLRVLIGAVVVGVATTFKRTILSLYFGRRNFEIYKPKLELILEDIIIIAEVAELAADAVDVNEEEDNLSASPKSTFPQKRSKQRRTEFGEARWASVKFKKGDVSRSDTERSQVEGDTEGDNSDSEDEKDIPEPTPLNRLPYEKRVLDKHRRNSMSGRQKIKNLLGRWEDPVNKMDKTADGTVEDILKFRKALIYMDLEQPFSVAFGLASNRDQLISSSEKVYSRLLKLSPNSDILPFSVLASLYTDEDGSFDREKKLALQNVFRPDMNDEVTKLEFIKTCDNVYKKLRYFRASVGNSSVIDNVLESIINTLFFFVLALLIMSLLNLNPWPFLVSMSTLLVTFAFAFGPSAAKAIEGILLIVGRRPFDIGDRIIIADSPGGALNGIGKSWWVEDITLFSTTLRFGANNEVATVSNGSIAAARISNCNRSTNAIINIDIKLQITMHDERNVELMREAIETYIVDNSHVWDSLVFFRCEEIDTDDEYVVYKVAVRHRHSWQNSGRTLMDRARLHQFTIALAQRMGIAYDSPAQRRKILYCESLPKLYDREHNKQGQIQNSGARVLVGAVEAQNAASGKHPDPVSRRLSQEKALSQVLAPLGSGSSGAPEEGALSQPVLPHGSISQEGNELAPLPTHASEAGILQVPIQESTGSQRRSQEGPGPRLGPNKSSNESSRQQQEAHTGASAAANNAFLAMIQEAHE